MPRHQGRRRGPGAAVATGRRPARARSARAGGPRAPYRSRDRRAPAPRSWPRQQGDRARPEHRRENREDARQQHPQQARCPEPHAGRPLRRQHRTGANALVRTELKPSVRILPSRLGPKLNLSLLAFMLVLGTAIAALMLFGFKRTQTDATSRSREGLEEQARAQLYGLSDQEAGIGQLILARAE